VAPMFSVRSFTSNAMCARRVIPAGSNCKRHTLGGQQGLVLAHQRRMGLREDGLEIFRRSGTATPPGSGTAPATPESGRWACSGGNAPLAMNRMWSVLMGPYLVDTAGALDQGQQIALHTLARHIGAAMLRAREATLSISSMKTMPFCSAERKCLRLDSPRR
jgi:hypothetical protein